MYKPLTIHIKADKVIHKMKGGIGASWHAMSKEIPLENEKYDYPVRMVCPRGSAYGGNPPIENVSAWEQIYYHAKWLGLNFIRVELSQRMYEPEKNKFYWENEEMKALYKILNWCELSGADVFLQQMWGHVEWNAYPGVHPLLSAPYYLHEFANGISQLLNYLIHKKKYTCIKYFCITNEPPGGTWGYWWSYGSSSGSITAALRKVNEVLRKNKIKIKLSGPDWTNLPPFDKSKIDFENYLGAFDIHSYSGINTEGEKIIRDWVNFAHHQNKPFFLTEFGNMNLGWGKTNSGPKSFNAALSNASDIISGLNLGVDGFNRWSFTNRGDLDGQWQLIRTWDTARKNYYKKVLPEPSVYYGFAIVSRFLGKYSKVLALHFNRTNPEIKAAAIQSSKNGFVTVFIVNSSAEDINLNVQIYNLNAQVPFYFYQVDQKAVSRKEFKLKPTSKLTSLNRALQIVIKAKSISSLSNHNLKSHDFGVIE
jgi:Cellulase (glycosyl hydrolase family 5)